MFPQYAPRPIRRLPDIRDLAGGLTVSALVSLLAIVVAAGQGADMGSPVPTPYMRDAEHGPSLCDAVFDRDTTERPCHVPLV
jgi:hypothetical protein